MTTPTAELRSLTRADLADAVARFAAERWQTCTTYPERTYRALTASGSTTLVARSARTMLGLVRSSPEAPASTFSSAPGLATGPSGPNPSPAFA
jgi:N-formylglutamate amidohydrolase